MWPVCLAPRAWCAFACNPNIEFKRNHTTVVLTHEKHILKIEVETGRILRYDSDGIKTYLEAGVFTRMRESFVKERHEKARKGFSRARKRDLKSYLASCGK